MPPASQPPPGSAGPWVAPVPVYGIEQPDGSLAQPRTVAEGAAAVRARVAANAALSGSTASRRVGAGLIDLAIGAGLAKGLSSLAPLSVGALIGLAIALTFTIRVVVATMTDGASPGRFITNTRAVDQDASRLNFAQHAVREAFVLLYLAASPLVLIYFIVRVLRPYHHFSEWLVDAEFRSLATAPVPQDHTTSTTVAATTEIRRVRARS